MHVKFHSVIRLNLILIGGVFQVKFYGAIRSKGGIHIFMQYAGGGSIQQLLRDNRGFVGSGSIDRHLFSEYWGVYYYKQVRWLSAVFLS